MVDSVMMTNVYSVVCYDITTTLMYAMLYS